MSDCTGARINARARWWPWTGGGVAGARGVLTARRPSGRSWSFASSHVGLLDTLPKARVHFEAIPHQRRMGGATRRNPVHDNASLKNFWPGNGNTCEWPLKTRQRPLCRRRRSSCRSRWPCGACRRSRCTRHLWQREPRRLCLPAFSRHCLPSCRSASPIVHRLLMLPKSSLQSKQPNRHLLSRKTPVWS